MSRARLGGSLVVVDALALSSGDLSPLSWACALGALTVASNVRQDARGTLRRVLDSVQRD